MFFFKSRFTFNPGLTPFPTPPNKTIETKIMDAFPVSHAETTKSLDECTKVAFLFYLNNRKKCHTAEC